MTLRPEYERIVLGALRKSGCTCGLEVIDWRTQNRAERRCGVDPIIDMVHHRPECPVSRGIERPEQPE